MIESLYSTRQHITTYLVLTDEEATFVGVSLRVNYPCCKGSIVIMQAHVLVVFLILGFADVQAVHGMYTWWLEYKKRKINNLYTFGLYTILKICLFFF